MWKYDKLVSHFDPFFQNTNLVRFQCTGIFSENVALTGLLEGSLDNKNAFGALLLHLSNVIL